MRRALLAAALAGATACAAAPPPPAETAPAASVTTGSPAGAPSAAEAPLPPCHPARLALDGLSVCMPAEPEEVREPAEDGGARGLAASIPAGPATAHFIAERLRFDKRTSPIPRVLELPGWGRVDVSREIEVDGFPARVMEGIDRAGSRASVKMVAVGNSVYLARVDRPPDAPLDPRLADAFLASLRVEVPWRIHASPADHYTIAVPEPAVVGENDKSPPGGAPRKMTTFALGGKDELAFVVAVAPVPPGSNRSADELLDGAVKAFSGPSTLDVRKARDPWSGSLRGREITLRDANGVHAHLRVFVTGSRLYVIGAQAKSAEAVSGVEALRFLESFQVAG